MIRLRKKVVLTLILSKNDDLKKPLAQKQKARPAGAGLALLKEVPSRAKDYLL